MDALILCSGFAKRLEPISEFIPKPLLHINGKPLIDHIIAGMDGIKVRRIIVSTNKRFEKQFRYWLAAKRAMGEKRIQLVVEPSTDNEERYGAIRSISNAIKVAGIRDDMLMFGGDNYFRLDIIALAKSMLEKRKPVVGLYNIKSREDAKLFGVVSIDKQSRIMEFEEKPENPRSTLISMAIYAFPMGHLTEFSKYLHEGMSPDNIGSFLEWLISHGDVYGHVYKKGSWFDIGTITTYRKLFYRYL